jgi:hypothetical protein
MPNYTGLSTGNFTGLNRIQRISSLSKLSSDREIGYKWLKLDMLVTLCPA